MKLTTLQKYNLNYCLNYFLATKPEFHELIKILKAALNESQSRDEFRGSMLALILLSIMEGPSKHFSLYILLNFFTPFHQDIFNEISQINGIGYPKLTVGEHEDLGKTLIAQKFPPALPNKEVAILFGYAPAQLWLGKMYYHGHGENEKEVRELFMQVFEQGLDDDEAMYYYTMCYEGNKNLERRIYLWKILIARNCKYSDLAMSELNQFSSEKSEHLKPFEQLLKEATPVENTRNGESITYASFGDPKAQAVVGFCYQIGLGVERNLTKAIHFYKLSRDSDTFCDLLSCYKQELINGNVDIKDIFEFYNQYLFIKDAGNHYKINASLIMASIYHYGISAIGYPNHFHVFVYPNFFKAYEYYSQVIKLSTDNPVHWEEENKVAEAGVKLIKPLIECRDQVMSSLVPLGITAPICNLAAEYAYDLPLPDLSDFANRIISTNSAFLNNERKRNAEIAAAVEMTMPVTIRVVKNPSSAVMANSLEPQDIVHVSQADKSSVRSLRI